MSVSSSHICIPKTYYLLFHGSFLNAERFFLFGVVLNNASMENLTRLLFIIWYACDYREMTNLINGH